MIVLFHASKVTLTEKSKYPYGYVEKLTLVKNALKRLSFYLFNYIRSVNYLLITFCITLGCNLH